MPHPLWFRIAKDYPYHNSSTVPFLLGAVSDDPGKDDLRSLLTTMQTPPKGYGLLIEHCGTKVNAHVIRIEEPGKGLRWRDFPDHDVSDLDSLCEALWDLYGKPISEGKYSKLGKGPWDVFNDQELETIQAFKDSETYPL